MADDTDPPKTPDPDPREPAAVSLPISTPQAQLLDVLHTSVAVGGAGSSQPGQGASVTTTAGEGVFKAGPVSGALQFGHTDTPGVGGVNSIGSQQTIVLGGTNTSQHNLLFTQNLTLDPKIAAQLGVGYEYAWGGDNPNRPKYMLDGAASGGTVRDGQVGNVTGDGHTATVGGAFTVNQVDGQRLNPKSFTSLELKGTEVDVHGPGGHATQLSGTATIVEGVNIPLDKQHENILTVGVDAFAGGADSGNGVKGFAGGGVYAGISFGAPPAPPKHEQPESHAASQFDGPDPKPSETHLRGTVREVDAKQDLAVIDIGGGVIATRKLSELRANTDDKNTFDQAMQHGRNVDIVTRADGHNSVTDEGRAKDEVQAKRDLLRDTTVNAKGELQIRNVTVAKDHAEDFKAWLAAPSTYKDGTFPPGEQKLIEQLDTLADKREPTKIGHGEVRQEPGAHAPPGAKPPHLGVHMTADGSGPMRGAGMQLKGCTVESVEDKGGVTTVSYTQGARHGAFSVSDTAGSFANSKDNPYNTPGIDAALKNDPHASVASNQIAMRGVNDTLRSLDAARPGATPNEPLASPKGTTGNDFLRSATIDAKQDLHIGNLTVKSEVAGFVLKAINEQGPRDPEMIARIERLAESKNPTELNLANTKEAAVNARDAAGFGDPANPLREPLNKLEPGQKFDLSVDRSGAATLVNRDEQQQMKIQPDGRVETRPTPTPELARQPAGHAL